MITRAIVSQVPRFLATGWPLPLDRFVELFDWLLLVVGAAVCGTVLRGAALRCAGEDFDMG
jgi:hypothetical protein